MSRKPGLPTPWPCSATAGNEPPATNDPTTPIAEASIWAAASTMGMALTQVLTSRVTARHLMDDSALEAQAEKARMKHKKLKVTV